jgi:DNA-binding CsgD family transcriptional regulator
VLDRTGSPRSFAVAVGSLLVNGAHVPANAQAAVVRELASRARTRSVASRRARELTPREREVLRLLGGGISRADIARRLDLTPHLVRASIDRAKAKLGVTTQREAIAVLAAVDADPEGADDEAPGADQPAP